MLGLEGCGGSALIWEGGKGSYTHLLAHYLSFIRCEHLLRS